MPQAAEMLLTQIAGGHIHTGHAVHVVRMPPQVAADLAQGLEPPPGRSLRRQRCVQRRGGMTLGQHQTVVRLAILGWAGVYVQFLKIQIRYTSAMPGDCCPGDHSLHCGPFDHAHADVAGVLFRVSFSAFVMMVSRMNLRIHALKSPRQRPASSISCRSALFFNFYIIHSAQKGRASSSKMYSPGNFFANRPIFVYFVDIPPRLTGAKWFVILLTIVPAGSRARAAAACRLSPQAYFFETDATKGSAFGMECRGRLLFILWRQMEGPL